MGTKHGGILDRKIGSLQGQTRTCRPDVSGHAEANARQLGATIAREERTRKLLPLELTSFDEAARRALA